MESLTKWDYAHMDAAHVYANLSHGRRAKVGCVIVKDNRIISIGYNGMPSGWDNNCEDEDWPFWAKNEKEIDPIYVKLKTKPEVLHAETNAIAKVARSGESSEGSSLYVTMAPCLDCAKLIHQSGISRVFYNNTYHKGDAGISFLEKCAIEVIHVPDR